MKTETWSYTFEPITNGAQAAVAMTVIPPAEEASTEEAPAQQSAEAMRRESGVEVAARPASAQPAGNPRPEGATVVREKWYAVWVN